MGGRGGGGALKIWFSLGTEPELQAKSEEHSCYGNPEQQLEIEFFPRWSGRTTNDFSV